MISTHLKLVIKALAPPILLSALRKMLGNPRSTPPEAPPANQSMFGGAYDSFDEAAGHSKGYDDAVIASAAAKRLSDMISSTTSVEIDGRFQQVHSAICVARDRMRKQALSVLDIGGANGSYFFRLKPLLPATELKWHVVETSNMVAACQSIASPHITFSTDIPDGLVWDIALISGALQYIPNAYEILGNAARAAKWLILTRLPIHDGPNDRFMVQTVPAHIHEGSMPIEIFSVTRIEAAILELGTIELSWSVSLDDGAFVAIPARSVGYLIKTKAH